MLPGELVIRLNQHMNMEFRAASLYIAKSSWFIEKGLTDIAQQFRLLAQIAVTTTLKFYEFLTNNQSAPFSEYRYTCYQRSGTGVANGRPSDIFRL